MKKIINCRGRLLDFSTPKVMGILNITPDSFFDGGKFKTEEAIIAHTAGMIEEGAAIVDVGAQSTRPNATMLSADEEWKRLEPVLRLLRKRFPDTIFSVDTFYSEIASRAVDIGADMINDVSGGNIDDKMFETIGLLNVPYVLMHTQGTPQTMNKNPQYKDIVKEVMDYFLERIVQLVQHGVRDIIIDPGFGFGKTLEHNYQLLSHLDLFKIFERPILFGISRKSMINKVLGTKPEEALNGTTVLNTFALSKGASILRVHDVREASEAVKLIAELND